jgi:uncharacterized membrane protein
MKKEKLKQRKWEIALTIILFVFMGAVSVWSLKVQNEYEHYNNENVTYVKGKVIETDNSELESDQIDSNRYNGVQYVKVQILEGELKGTQVDIENYLMSYSNVYVEPGMKVIVSVDQPEGTEPYCLIYNYYRSPYIYLMIAALAVLMIWIGGAKGIRAFLGLAFCLFTVIMLMLPMIYQGYSPVLASVVTVVITTAVSLLLLNGISKKTTAAIISTAVGVIIAGIIFAIMSWLLHVSGYNMDETEYMVLVAQNTSLKVGEVLFAGVLISALGAVMDVGMSVSSAIFELHEANPKMTQSQLVKSGMNIGKDMIGTMSNTLILAFVGSCIGEMLVLTSYGIRYHQFINSDFIAIEIGQGLSGTMAVILTVPVASFVASYLCHKNIIKRI